MPKTYIFCHEFSYFRVEHGGDRLVTTYKGCTKAQAVSGFSTRSVHLEFVVDKVALEQVSPSF
jgi:hypothetical protein